MYNIPFTIHFQSQSILKELDKHKDLVNNEYVYRNIAYT